MKEIHFSNPVGGLFGHDQSAADMPTLPEHLQRRVERGQFLLARLGSNHLKTSTLTRKESREQTFNRALADARSLTIVN
jgi:hypothetical protein